LKGQIQCPLRDAIDNSTSKPYVLCEYNRHGSSYRSPFSNKYDPPVDENENATVPSSELRKIEILANDVFESYAHLYYGKDVLTSVYCWNKDSTSTTTTTSIEKGFSMCFLVKHIVKEEDFNGVWNCSHVVHISILSKDQAKYEITSSVLLSITNTPIHHLHDSPSSVQTGGTLSKQVEKVCPYNNDGNSHVSNIGHIIEEVETELRSSADSLYIQKNKEIVNSIRSDGSEGRNRHGLMQAMVGQGSHGGVSSELHAAMMARLKNRRE
jgi:capping protein (actin filament) muscle Z-line, beta